MNPRCELSRERVIIRRRLRRDAQRPANPAERPRRSSPRLPTEIVCTSQRGRRERWYAATLPAETTTSHQTETEDTYYAQGFPPPRFHLMRYLGVLAGHSSLRAEVVPNKPAAPPKQLPLFDERDEPTTFAKSSAKKTAEPSRHPWPWLLQRVFDRPMYCTLRRAGDWSGP